MVKKKDIIKGKFDGEWHYYNENGFPVGIGQFDNGNGVLTTFIPYSDNIQSITYFENNQKMVLKLFCLLMEILSKIIINDVKNKIKRGNILLPRDKYFILS